MPVNIGDEPGHGFDQPIGLLRDCHRRIEKFLGLLIRVVTDTRGAELDGEHRTALEAALRYFKQAAPWHTRDEEDSLFPRMRRLDDPHVLAILSEIETLESDHTQADAMHAEVDWLGTRWLQHRSLTADEVQRMGELLRTLRQTYQRHITEEDDVIFPLAQRVLSAASLAAIGREMAERRGLDPGLPPRRCRHGPSLTLVPESQTRPKT
jgi:hemerythrin-like domain-containing protein